MDSSTSTRAMPNQRTTSSEEPDLAERFMTAWKHLETELAYRWSAAQPRGSRGRPDAVALLRWAQVNRVVSASVEDFLHSCRVARNAYSHVAFEGYVGPVTLPPEPVVVRVERITQSLRNPVLAGSVAVEAVTCLATTPLADALRTMHANDFSQLPYPHPQHGWLLVTSDQVGRYVAAHMDDDGTVVADLGITVGELADDPRVGPVRPVTVPASTPVDAVVNHLEHALVTRDDQPGGYPVVLVRSKGAACRLVAGDDLPHLYDVLGR